MTRYQKHVDSIALTSHQQRTRARGVPRPALPPACRAPLSPALSKGYPHPLDRGSHVHCGMEKKWESRTRASKHVAVGSVAEYQKVWEGGGWGAVGVGGVAAGGGLG